MTGGAACGAAAPHLPSDSQALRRILPQLMLLDALPEALRVRAADTYGPASTAEGLCWLTLALYVWPGNCPDGAAAGPGWRGGR